MRRAATLAIVLLLAGCVSPEADEPSAPPADPSEIRLGNALLHAGGAPGGLGLVHLAEGERAEVTFPADVLVMDAERRLVPGGEPMPLARGEVVQYLTPYGAPNVTVSLAVGGETRDVVLPEAPGHAIARGDRVVDLLKIQRDRFAHRTPGHENFTKAVAYFGEFFAALGYEVENFRTPLPDEIPTPAPLPIGLSPQSLVSVLGYKRGTDLADRYIVMGGHFDIVEETTHGAFDNTGGTMATLAMAEAFANVTTRRTIVFAAWGGEEDGILGSQAWISAHPELVPFIDLYVNFDVTGMAWPAPLVDPAPVVATTGPDGPLGEALAAQHALVLSDWMKLDAPFQYEGVAQGQATGAGVNAQSDHTPFMARSIPALMQFTSRVPDVFGIIHSENDTVENMTAYALLGIEGIGTALTPAEVREGEAALARSFETQMMPAFYLAVLLDNGQLPAVRGPPGVVSALANARS